MFGVSLILTLVSLVALAIIDAHLKTPASPLGIVSFELCAFQSSCATIPASWDAMAKLYAAMSLGLDYLFMLAYPAAISCGLRLLLNKQPGRWRKPTLVMAKMVWVAGLADAVENYHLFQMLMGQPISNHQWIASLSATAKFVILVPALALGLLGVVRSMQSRATPA